jgi:NADH-quinone oxidoreductase subunit G
MPQLLIDDHKIIVPSGTKIIDAAEQAGIVIPRFCYHPALGAVGACRVCAVNIIEGPATGIKMSCRTDVEDGMVVSTTDATAVDFRRHVIEWLMLNHPHDCPVCDEGGQCLLQDLTVAGGHGIRRFKGRKRTYEDQYLGPLVQHEMNRCIQCYRCSRFYREFAGYRDLGVMGIASRIYFGRYRDGILKSPFAGNLIDICPTGVYTDRPSRFTGRSWDFERQPSICIHCSLGCGLTVSARFRQIVRQEAGYHPSVNGHFICDRGRYGFYYANLEDRPRTGRVDGRSVPAGKAVRIAMQGFEDIHRKYGSSAVAVLSSTRCSLETLAAAAGLCRNKGWQPPYTGLSRHHLQNVHAVLRHLSPENVLSLKDVETSAVILVVGADPVNEAPMLALSIRQAVRNGAEVLILDPRPLEQPFDFRQLAVGPQGIHRLLERFLSAYRADGHSNDIRDETGPGSDLRDLLDFLGRSGRTAVICGTDIVDHRIVFRCAELVSRLRQPAGMLCPLPGPNAYGTALINREPRAIEDLLENIERGDLKAVLLVEADLFWDFPDRDRVSRAFKRVELLAALDYVSTQTAQAASVFIPTRTIYESGGIFINHEGRLRSAPPVFKGGTPIGITGHGGHPPREFGKAIPGGDTRAAWEILVEMDGEPDGTSRPKLLKWMGDACPDLTGALQSPGNTDERVLSKAPPPGPEYPCGPETEPGDETGFEVLMTEDVFGTEILSSHSPCLKPLTKAPLVWMNTQSAEALGLNGQGSVWISVDTFRMKWELKISPMVPEGIIIMPRLAHAERRVPDLGGRRLKMNQLSGADGST